ncbi:MAG: tRNA 4-thiouridine(8) synthase ThiI [Candidatus Omnitrophica bacterium]|nr:tRNA 4-thiouridine(8) synthase ThiI [Candidatus Omnitrophota bacterium]
MSLKDKNKVKAIGVVSGGLDSMLAATLIKGQGVEVYLLNFIMPWQKQVSKSVINLAANLEAKLILYQLDDIYIELIKNPKYGYGSAFNPCIDCHMFMFKAARKYLKEIEADFVFTGEVLAQRPMSQMRDKLALISKECDLEGRLLRPLSALLLEPTIPENEGLIDRSQLMNISGRSRKEQIKLAQKLGITDYPQPAGGCLLTDKVFGERTKDLLSNKYNGFKDMISLQWGRHFRINENFKAILGRKESENNLLVENADPNDYIICIENDRGPTLILKGETPNEEIFKICGGLIKHFSKSKTLDSVRVQYFKASFPKELFYFNAISLGEDYIDSMNVCSS